MALSSIKLYLAAVYYMQVLLGLLEPQAESSLPRLRLVLNGISRSRTTKGTPLSKPRLPIMTNILWKLFEVLSRQPPRHTRTMHWAACSLCFFEFFRVGEITVSTKSVFDPHRHFAGGDVSVNNVEQPSLLKAHLKFSKCDQFGKSIDIFVDSTNNEICLISARLAYITVRGSSPGPFFCLEDGSPLTKAMFVSQVRGISS